MDQPKHRTWITAAALAALVMAGWLVWNSWGYAEVSRTGYEHAMALVSACNRQDRQRLEKIVASIQQAAERKQLPAYDAEILLRIAQRAREGDWEWSSRQVRHLMLDQIK